MMAKKQVIGCEQLVAAIMLFAQKESQLCEYGGVMLQDDWEDVRAEDLIECVRRELTGKELVVKGG